MDVEEYLKLEEEARRNRWAATTARWRKEERRQSIIHWIVFLIFGPAWIAAMSLIGAVLAFGLYLFFRGILGA